MDVRIPWSRDTLPETNTSFVVVNPKSLLTPDLLLHFDTSTGFRDSATRNHTINVLGDATIDTSKFVFGDASASFGATTIGAIQPVNDVDGCLSLHEEDFTIDFRIQWISVTANQHIVTEGDTDPFFVIGKNGLNQIYYIMSPLGSGITSTTTVAADGAWRHIAVTRQANVVRLFINGTQEGVTFIEGVTDPTNNGDAGYNYEGSFFVIGDGGSGFDSHAWIDEFRLIKGYAAWTSNFTPPTAPYTTIG